MPELLGDNADVEPLAQQLRGVDVAQAVDVHALVDPHPPRQQRQEPPDIRLGQAAAVDRAEEK